MARIHKCDLCGKISDGFAFYNEEYCNPCTQRLNDIEIEAYQKVRKRMEQWYKKGACNNAAVVEFCHHIMTTEGALFIEDYGSKSWDLLLKAVA